MGAGVRIGEAGLHGEPGVVHEHVHGSLGVLDPGGDAVHVGAVGEVRGQDLDRHAVLRAQPGGRLLEAVRVAGHQDECISPAGQGFGERGADAGRPPGHESGKHEI